MRFLGGFLSAIRHGISIRQKLIALGFVVIAVQIGQFAISVWVDGQAVDGTRRVFAVQKHMSAIQAIRINILQIMLEIDDIIMTREMGILKSKELTDLPRMISTIQSNHSLVLAGASSEDEIRLAESIQNNINEISKAVQIELPRLQATKAPGWEFIELGDNVREMGNSVNAALSTMGNSAASSASEAVLEGEKASEMASIVSLVVVIVSAMLLTVAIVWIAKGLLGGIRNLNNMLRDMAEGHGDLTKRIVVESGDELGELAGWFNQFAENLRGQLEKVAQNTNILSTSAKELLSISNTLVGGTSKITEGATNVTSATEQLSSNINTMASSVEQISQVVSNISNSAGKMSQDMSGVSSVMERMKVSIVKIDDSAKDSSKTARKAMDLSRNASQAMSSLGAGAQEIGKVTILIKKIAEQTNLLALNAKIEAASAGSAGKGFAVVANEIKQLADQSAKAAEEISAKINGMRENTNKAVQVIADVALIINSMTNSVKTISHSVEEQVGMVGEISQNIGMTAEGAHDMASSLQEISATASNVSQNVGDAAQGTNGVFADIRGVSSEVNGQSDGIQRINGASRKLAMVAVELNSVVRQFKLA
ncbi:MAG: methyl-accepting chemotaxis protein [Nitrospinota bacterium]|nr:methyl-accepting chemotaxis protein [Nitrospinota bacterium]